MQFKLFEQSSEPWNPHPYQKKAVKFLLEHAACALLLYPGLGKTSITLAAIKILKKKKLINKVLIIAPLRVCYGVWPKEVKKWADFDGLKINVLHGPKRENLLNEEADIYIINPEGLDWLMATTKTKTLKGKTKVGVDLARWKKFGFDTLIFDELSKFKHVNVNRFKTIKQVLGTFSRRWGLTGSPVANGLEDLFGQMYVVDQGRTFGPYITHYRMLYFLPDPSGYGWVIRPGADDEIYKKISPMVLRMTDEDYLSMPKVIENNIMVDLPNDVSKIYDQLKEDLIAQIESNLVTASTAATASMKCRQIANGGIYLDPEVEALIRLPKTNREWVNLHTEKVDALSDLVDELQGSPLLVAYDFKHDLDRIQEKLGKDIPYIGGGVSPKRTSEVCDLWNAGKIPVLLGHPQAMAHGLNLQESGHHICWHSLTWDYELYDQFIRRVFRQGNKSKKVFVHHIIARGTIDEYVLASLKSKRNGHNALFDALKKLK